MLNGLNHFFHTTVVGRLIEDPSGLLGLVMMGVGLLLIFLGITKKYEPLLLVPIGFGMLLGNLPGSGASPQDGGVIHYLYFGVTHEIFPALIFLGVGAMTDFSAMLSQPRTILLGAGETRFFSRSQVSVMCHPENPAPPFKRLSVDHVWRRKPSDMIMRDS